jgi:hypothetical protein
MGKNNGDFVLRLHGFLCVFFCLTDQTHVYAQYNVTVF